MLVNGKPYRTVWMEGREVKMIDQTLLPHKFEIISFKNHGETAKAIKEMKVRGAPAIGVTAGYALTQAILEAPANNFLGYIKKAKETIEKTRPTAHDLFYATKRVFSALENLTPQEARAAAVNETKKIAEECIEMSKKIGEHGSPLIKNSSKVLTHCNAGSLAALSHGGTALAPIFRAVQKGKDVFVYIDETRPRGQGASLTAWELLQAGIPHRIIPDNAAGFLMQKKEIDIVIVGCDRVCANGDFANKIGTYEKALCAKENGIPFYVAAPTSTIDFSLSSGEEIPIEERSEEEVLSVWGKNEQGKCEWVRIAPEGSRALNLAFDVTSGSLITAFITERGIFKPHELHRIKSYMSQKQR